MDQQIGSPMNTDSPGIFGNNKAALEALLPDYLRGQRWFSAKARTITGVRVVGEVPFATGDGLPLAYLTFIEVAYAEGEPQTFVLPLAFASGATATQLQQRARQAVVAPFDGATGESGILYDASWDARF